MAATIKPQVSALGILAQIDIVLQRHRQQFSPQLSSHLSKKVAIILPTLGVKLDNQKLAQISSEISKETTRESLENLGRAQSPDQIQQIITDSLTQSIIAHPQLESVVNMPEEQIYQTAQAQVQDVVKNHQPALEKAAVLTKLSQAARLQKPDQTILSFASDQVEETLEVTSPLMPPESRSEIKAAISSYIQTYPQKLADVLKESAPAISFDQMQKAQTAAHEQALAASNIKPALATSFKDAAENVANHLGLTPLSAEKIQSLGLGDAQPKPLTFAKAGRVSGFGVGLTLNTPRIQREAFYSLLAYNREKLEKSLNELTAKVEGLKKQESLAYRDRKELLAAQKKLQLLKSAQQFPQSQPKRFKTYLAYFQGWPAGRTLAWSSNRAWNTTAASFNQYPGIYTPISALGNQHLMAGRTFGGLAFGLGNFKLGSLGSLFKLKGAIGPLSGMGIATGIMKRVAKATGTIFGGLALLFLGLGKAAFFGFLVGAAVGGLAGLVAGATFGLAIASVFGPFAPAVALVTVPLGALAGAFGLGSIGGIAGGLIALGMAMGTMAFITIGAGVAIGGAIGGFLGAGIGGILGSLALSWLGPFGIGLGYALGAFVGSIIGAFVGAAFGAGLGYITGRWIIPGFKAAGGIISSAFSALGSSLAGFFSGLGGFLTGLASTIWGGLASAAAGIANAIAGFFSSLIGGSASASSTATLTIVSVGGAIGSVAVGSLLVGILTAAALLVITSENEYAILAKQASPTVITNKEAATGIEVAYSITIRAKGYQLSNVVVRDNTFVSPQGSPSFADFAVDINGNSTTFFNLGTIAAGEQKKIEYTILVKGEKYKDTVIYNTADLVFQANNENSSLRSTAYVTVGERQHFADCTPASDGNDANGIETNPFELACHIKHVASGKTEKITGLPLQDVMLKVMNAESGGNQCAAGSAAEIGVFQYIASTWKARTDSSLHLQDSGSGTYRSGRQVCWGIPGPDPTPQGTYAGNSLYDWQTNFGPNLDGGAWDPYEQIAVTALIMEQSGGGPWTTWQCHFNRSNKSADYINKYCSGSTPTTTPPPRLEEVVIPGT